MARQSPEKYSGTRIQSKLSWGHNIMEKLPLVVSAIFLSYLAAPASADENKPRSIHGAYTAELDLNPINIPLVERFGFILHTDGTLVASSEHEVDDMESVGIGVWKSLPRGQIGLGYFNFRIGTMGGCTVIFGVVPPENCTLKLGATVEREDGGLVGNALISFEKRDGTVVTIPVLLPFAMTRLSLEDFPGAFPSP